MINDKRQSTIENRVYRIRIKCLLSLFLIEQQNTGTNQNKTLTKQFLNLLEYHTLFCYNFDLLFFF